MVAVRAWFKWLARNNHVLYNPAADIELSRTEHRLPKCVLTASEAEQVINQTDISTRLGIRDRAILETFYSTGMRRMELMHLRPCDIDMERGTVVIRQGKGKKDRMIPIGDRALAWIERYQIEVRPGLLVGDSAGDVLFLTHLGKPFSPDQMSALVGQYVAAAGIGKEGSCHLLRHTMATVMLENGAGIRYIQAMLGHAKLETTQIYTRVSIRKLKEVHHGHPPGPQGTLPLTRGWWYNSPHEPNLLDACEAGSKRGVSGRWAGSIFLPKHATGQKTPVSRPPAGLRPRKPKTAMGFLLVSLRSASGSLYQPRQCVELRPRRNLRLRLPEPPGLSLLRQRQHRDLDAGQSRQLARLDRQRRQPNPQHRSIQRDRVHHPGRHHEHARLRPCRQHDADCRPGQPGHALLHV